MFGLNAMLEGSHPKETAISLGFSSVYTILESDFLSILRENKTDYVKENSFLLNLIFKKILILGIILYAQR